MRNKIASLAVVALSLSACNATEIYSEAKAVNDKTFAASIVRVCGLTAVLASERQLTLDEQVKLKELCALVDQRKLTELRDAASE